MDQPHDSTDHVDELDDALAAHAHAAATAQGAVIVECGLHRSHGSTSVYVVVHAADGMDAARLGELTADLQFRLGTEPVLDEATLEVSTPGINRKLKTDAEYEIFVGKAVRILAEDADEWQEGLIAAASGDHLTLAPLPGRDEEGASVPLTQIRKAQLTGAERLAPGGRAHANSRRENTDVE